MPLGATLIVGAPGPRLRLGAFERGDFRGQIVAVAVAIRNLVDKRIGGGGHSRLRRTIRVPRPPNRRLPDDEQVLKILASM